MIPFLPAQKLATPPSLLVTVAVIAFVVIGLLWAYTVAAIMLLSSAELDPEDEIDYVPPTDWSHLP